MDVPRGRWRARARLASVLIFAVAAAAAILLALTEPAFEDERGKALAPVLLAIAAGAALLAGWTLENRRTAARRAEAERLAEQAEREIEAARASVREAEAARDEALAGMREAERQARSETDRAQRIDNQRTLEREWHREMRSKMVEAHHEHGPLGDTSDLRTLPFQIRRVAVILDGFVKQCLRQIGEPWKNAAQSVAG